MALFRSLRNSVATTTAVAMDVRQVKNLRKAIFEVRDRLKGSPQYSQIFYSIINDVNHPPRHIVANQSGCFWTEAWQGTTYEPFSTMKYQDPNIAYIEGCAVYLLIQESYPNVYKFPNNRMDDILNGAQIELIMEKKFIDKTLQPAVIPPAPAPAPVQQVPVQQVPAPVQQVPAPVQQAPAPVQQAPAPVAGGFCPNCGTRREVGARFCANCGNPLG